MKNFIKKAISLLLVTVCCFTVLQGIETRIAYGASKYVTRGKMIEMIIKELEVKVNQTSPQPYIEAAKKMGLITEKTFTKYDSYATKIDVAILLVRADEYLNGVTISSELLNEIIDERISDIKTVKKIYQTYLAKAYALGYIKGSSNGSYSKNRKFNPNYKVTVTYAKQLVSFIDEKSKRHQISPDGQLIRTNNLPEFAEYYPYILASFPNEYYDWEFQFMKYEDESGPIFGTKYLVNLLDYASPKDFVKYKNGEKVFAYGNRRMISAKEAYTICSNTWEEKVFAYLNAAFNVDYKTIRGNTIWYDTIVNSHAKSDNNKTSIKVLLDKYIKDAVENETIVTSSIIAVDKSSIYIEPYGIYIRAYVRFCVKSSKDNSRLNRSPIIFTCYNDPDINNIVNNEWRDCYFDINISIANGDCDIREAVINDYYHNVRMVK